MMPSPRLSSVPDVVPGLSSEGAAAVWYLEAAILRAQTLSRLLDDTSRDVAALRLPAISIRVRQTLIPDFTGHT